MARPYRSLMRRRRSAATVQVVETMAIMTCLVSFVSVVPLSLSFAPSPPPTDPNSSSRSICPSSQEHLLRLGLYYAATSDDADVEQDKWATTMSAREMRDELQSYGVDTRIYFEKSELVDALRKARDGGRPRPVGTNKEENANNNGAEAGVGNAPSSGASTSTSSNEGGGGASSSSSTYSRAEQIKRKMEKYKTLRVGELKQRLEDLGIATKAFLEKSEFVKALAEARAYDPTYKDVKPQKFRFDPYDPRMKGLIEISPDGEASTAPPPRDRYGRDEFGYNGYGREEKWEGRPAGEQQQQQQRQQQQQQGPAGRSKARSTASPSTPPPPDEYQQRYEKGSSARVSSGQVPFTERTGRSGSGVDSGWWDQPYRSGRR